MKIKREDMPQTKAKDRDIVLNELRKECKLEYNEVCVKELYPIQSTVNKKKLAKMYENISKKKSVVPIFISEDNFIVDGHHRWLACELAFGPDVEMPTWKMILPKEPALELYSKISEKLK